MFKTPQHKIEELETRIEQLEDDLKIYVKRIRELETIIYQQDPTKHTSVHVPLSRHCIVTNPTKHRMILEQRRITHEQTTLTRIELESGQTYKTPLEDGALFELTGVTV